MQHHGLQGCTLGDHDLALVIGLEHNGQSGTAGFVGTLQHPAGKDLALGSGQHGSGQVGSIGIVEAGGQDLLALHEGQADLASGLGNILVGHFVAQPAAVVLLVEEQGLVEGIFLHGAVLTGHVQRQSHTDGEDAVAVHGIAGNIFVGKLVAVVILHPALVLDGDDVTVLVGGGIEILGNGGAAVDLFDHPLAVGLDSIQSQLLVLLGDGVGLGHFHIGVGGFVVGHFLAVAGGIHHGDGGSSHQAGDLLSAHPNTGQADGQEVLSGGGSDLDGVAVVQGDAVDVGGVAVHLLDPDGIVPGQEQFHLAQLPVGNVSFGFLNAVQGEGGDLLIAQLDNILLYLEVLSQTGGGFQIGQLSIADLVFHVGNVGILALKQTVFNTGHVVQGGPVGIGEQLGENLLALDGGLGCFIVH